MTRIKILVSCGSGIATSKLVASKVKVYLENQGIDSQIDTCSVSELMSKHDYYDVLLTTARGDFNFGKPVINAVPFITGLNIATVQEELLEEIKKINKV